MGWPKEEPEVKKFYIMVVAVFAILIAGCMGPAKVEPIEEIGANETAFMIPLEGASKDSQGKFMSEEFLQENKVAGKRVVIPVRERKIGRGYWNYEWIPTVKVIRVDRTPVTMKVDIPVESKESIGFKVGVTMTAVIEEDNAATYLYWYNIKPLSEVMASNVFGMFQKELSAGFGGLTIDQCRDQKIQIIDASATKVKKFFEGKGMTMLNIGQAEGLTYERVELQQSIDNAYIADRVLERSKVDAETAKEVAKGKAMATVEKAKGDAEAVLIAARAEAEANLLVSQSITTELALWQGVKKWSGMLPVTLMTGDAPKKVFDVSGYATQPSKKIAPKKIIPKPTPKPTPKPAEAVPTK